MEGYVVGREDGKKESRSTVVSTLTSCNLEVGQVQQRRMQAKTCLFTVNFLLVSEASSHRPSRSCAYRAYRLTGPGWIDR